jgi:hypothetical protein
MKPEDLAKAEPQQNRLVAAELELRWNRALERVTNLQERIDAHDRQRPAQKSVTPDDFASKFCCRKFKT